MASAPSVRWLPWWAPPWRSSVLREVRAPSLPVLGGSAPASAPGVASPGYVNGAAATPGHWRACSWKCKYGRLGIAVRGETLTTPAHRPDESFLFMTSDSRCSTVYRGTVDLYMGTEGRVLKAWKKPSRKALNTCMTRYFPRE